MACNITRGRLEPCKNNVGGLKMAYAINYVPDAFTVTNGVASAISVAVDAVYPFELRSDSNTLVESLVADRNNGTKVNTQTLTIALKKQDSETALQVDLMAEGRPIFIVRDNNNRYRIVGLSDGMDLSGSDITSGGARGDFNGYNLTFTATEGELAPYLDEATVTALLALVVDPNAPIPDPGDDA